MKPIEHKMNFGAGVLLVALLSCGSLVAAPTNQPADTNLVIRSTFVLPSSPKEGCDPFYPNSMRPYGTAQGAPHVVTIASLSLKGISGTPDHRLVIINNHTFSEGEEGDVVMTGGRIHVRCIQITSHSAIIEAAGQRRELTLPDNP